MKTGVYIIKNIATSHQNDCYIGSAAIDLERRYRKHTNDLKTQRHHSRHLQNAWNKYDAENFVFKILLYCDPKNCLMYEQIALDYFKPRYNICTIAGSSLGVKRSAKTIAKRCANMPTQVGENNPFYGRKHKVSSITKISGINNGMSGMFGEKNPNSKLTDLQRKAIYRLGRLGLSQRKRAGLFKVSKFTIARIDKDLRWAE